MKKLFISILLFLTLIPICFATEYHSVEDYLKYEELYSLPRFENTIQADIPAFPIVLNGKRYDSLHSAHPALLYKDIVYLPLTWDINQQLGIKLTFYLYPEADDRAREKYIVGVSRAEEGEGDFSRDMRDTANYKSMAYLCDNIHVAVQSHSVNNDEEYPFLFVNGVYYMPLTWKYAHECMDWDYGYSEEGGLYVNTENTVRPIFNEMHTDMYLGHSSFVILNTDYVYYDGFYLSLRPDYSVRVTDKKGTGGCIVTTDKSLKDIDFAGFVYRDYSEKYPAPTYTDGILSIDAKFGENYGVGVRKRMKIDMSCGKVIEVLPLE